MQAICFPLRVEADGPAAPREIDFGRASVAGRFITFRELAIWAGSHNAEVLPDDPGRGLVDFEAEVVPPSGMEFRLLAPGSGRCYLYLDLVGFRPLPGRAPSRVAWLDVFVNGKRIETIYQGGRHFQRKPVALVIDRENAWTPLLDRALSVRLVPSPGQGLFAVWDAYTSLYPEAAPSDAEAAQPLRPSSSGETVPASGSRNTTSDR